MAAEAQRNRDLLRLLRQSLERSSATLRTTVNHDGASPVDSNGGDVLNLVIESLELARQAMAAASGDPMHAAETPESSIAKKEESSSGGEVDSAISSSSEESEVKPSPVVAELICPKSLLSAVNQELVAFVKQCAVAQALAKQKQEARKKNKQPSEGKNTVGGSSSSSGAGAGGKVNSDGTWSCSSCTFSNKASARRCEVCFTYRPAAAGAEARKEEKKAVVANRAMQARDKKRRAARRQKESKGSDADSNDDSDGSNSEDSEDSDDESGSGDSDDNSDESGSENGSSSENENENENEQRDSGKTKSRGGDKDKERQRDKAAVSRKRPDTASKSKPAAASSSSSNRATKSSNSSSKPDTPKFSSPAASPRPGTASGIHRKRSFEELNRTESKDWGRGAGDTPSSRAGAGAGAGGGGGSGGGSRLWLGASSRNPANGTEADDADPIEGTILVWTCTLCTLENSMRARQCDACGETRAHAIRGFDGGDGTPRQAPKRVKIQGTSANPRKFPSIGAAFQLDQSNLPEAAPWDAAKAKRDHGIEGDDDSEFWTSVWIAPRTSKGRLIEECRAEDLNTKAERDLHAMLCTPRVKFLSSKLPSQLVPLPNCSISAAAANGGGSGDNDDANGAGDDPDSAQDRDRDKRALEKIQTATAAQLAARSDDEIRHNAIDEFLAAHPTLQSRALELLWKLDYDLESAAIAIQQAEEEVKAAAEAGERSAADSDEATRQDRVIPCLDEDTRASMVEALGRHGEAWAKVKVKSTPHFSFSLFLFDSSDACTSLPILEPFLISPTVFAHSPLHHTTPHHTTPHHLPTPPGVHGPQLRYRTTSRLFLRRNVHSVARGFTGRSQSPAQGVGESQGETRNG